MESGGLFLQKRITARGPSGFLAQETHSILDTGGHRAIVGNVILDQLTGTSPALHLDTASDMMGPWISLDNFVAADIPNDNPFAFDPSSATPLLRFVRWRVVDTGTWEACFEITYQLKG